MSIVLFTGFPGFLGSELLPRVLQRSPEDRAVCLVQSKFLSQARSRLQRILQAHPQFQPRIELVEGDITQPDLGLADAARIRKETSEIFHLAAIYDLGVARDVAVRVNVDGTRNVLNLAEQVPQLCRLHYVSTCFVSGRYPGQFSEDDLDKGQPFNNFYEETKFLAEVDVKARVHAGLPATVYRPAIVVGNSRTGFTQKYDGPYFVIRWLLRQPSIAILPIVGDPSATRVNLVPQDYVVDAISYLCGLDTSVGQVFHLADPRALTVDALVKVLGDATCRRVLRVRLPLSLAKWAIDHLPGVYGLMQIPSNAIDYFVHPTVYTCDRTLLALEGSGVKVPPFPTYVDRLVDYVRCHPEIGSKPMA